MVTLSDNMTVRNQPGVRSQLTALGNATAGFPALRKFLQPAGRLHCLAWLTTPDPVGLGRLVFLT